MRPRLSINKAFTKTISTIAEAIKELEVMGIVVEKIECDVGGIPTLMIEKNRICNELIASGKAIQYVSGHDEKGSYYRYQWRESGCRIVFEVR